MFGGIKMNEKEKKITVALVVAIAVMIVMNICGSITASKKDEYTFDANVEGSDYILNTENNNTTDTSDNISYNNMDENTTEEVTEPTTAEATTQATTEATTEATKETASSDETATTYDMNSSTGYMFPDADTRVITKEELESLSKAHAKYAKNEIYARNHYIFRSGGAMESYFTNKDWYSGEYSDQDDVLYNKCNATERKNILNLKKYE